ncbi:4-(cytidine 5'-diphospho)-2-C-methyl-D-erythritol kinase [Mucilaginibacter koreensis]
MLAFPNAKINIGLNITERRPDGYHNLETVFYPVQIKDALEVIEHSELLFTSSGIPIPGDANQNLCLKAYHALRADFDLPPVHIHLHKNIPIGAGLGGGSSDAAFFIKLMNEKFELNLLAEQMMNYARPLGADCAFFINNTPTYAFERGDRFMPVPVNLSAYCLVIVMPPVHVSTAEAYRGVVPSPSKNLLDQIQLPVGEWQHVVNDFENHILVNHPAIADVKKQLYAAGAVYASMSGSGAAVFGIFHQQPDLSLLQPGNQVFVNV